MTVEQFVDNLKENKIEDAIQSMQEELCARVATSITESRQSILENLGFTLNEEKDEEEDMDDNEDDSDEEEKDDE
jgi:ribosomal protein L12E/L44/L45/RPP1/RPP2